MSAMTAALALSAVALTAGCGPAVERPARTSAAVARLADPQARNKHDPNHTRQPQSSPSRANPKSPPATPTPQRVLANDRAAPSSPSPAVLPPVDDERIAAQGIRKLTGNRLTLYTDLPLSDEIAALPELIDQAYPQWCRYFNKGEWLERAWPVRGALMNDKAKFVAAGLLPPELPPFPHGFSRSHEIWLYEQDTAYYRRSLLLHEATHAFMFTVFGDCGPPWYMEATAELLAGHSLVDDRLTLDVFPVRRDDAPGWGRIRLVRDAVADGRAVEIDEILNYPPEAHLLNEPYGWCWALAALLDGDPRYRARFRELPQSLPTNDFNRIVRERFAADWPELNDQWRVFIHEIDYGYDLQRAAIDFAPGAPLAAEGHTVTVAADRGWQSSRISLEAGVVYRLEADGRYQVADQPTIWWCEPGGVTLRYYHGRPLGMLLAAIRPEAATPDAAAAPGGFLQPYAVGLDAELTPTVSGTLYLRINESPAALTDNAGTLEVSVKQR
jgi:hypothetical protein